MNDASGVGRIVLHLLAGLMSLMGLGDSAQDHDPVPPGTPVRIMPLGDSITDGLNVPGGYRIELWRRLRLEGREIDFVGSRSNGPAGLGDHDHEGHPGWTIDDVRGHVIHWLRSSDPRIVLLHIGTNDLPRDPAGAPARLSRLIDRITGTAPRAHLYVSTLVPSKRVGQEVRWYNRELSRIVLAAAAGNARIHLVHMHGALSTDDLLDSTHPTRTGYARMAAVWDDALRSFWKTPVTGRGADGPVQGPDRARSPAGDPTAPVPGGSGRILEAAISPVTESAAAGQKRPSRRA